MSLDPAPPRYRPRHEQDVLALVRAHPFAWVISTAGGFCATPLPLRPELGPSGELLALLGHYARANPQLARLREQSRVQLLFMGPHGYISPSWLTDRTQAPTWNYACATFECELSWQEDAAQTQQILADLVESMEYERANPWRIDEMGPRYPRMAAAVIGFRAQILARRVVFKLGQDESAAQFAQILNGLEGNGPSTLADWMRGSWVN